MHLECPKSRMTSGSLVVPTLVQLQQRQTVTHVQGIFWTLPLFTAWKRSRGKVIFSQACVKNSVRGGVHPVADTPPGRHPPRADTPQTNTPSRQTPSQADTPLGRHPPRQTATAADGTHPTGMHSCCLWIGIQLRSWRSYKYLRWYLNI